MVRQYKVIPPSDHHDICKTNTFESTIIGISLEQNLLCICNDEIPMLISSKHYVTKDTNESNLVVKKCTNV